LDDESGSFSEIQFGTDKNNSRFSPQPTKNERPNSGFQAAQHQASMRSFTTSGRVSGEQQQKIAHIVRPIVSSGNPITSSPTSRNAINQTHQQQQKTPPMMGIFKQYVTQVNWSL
jgi:hypothetical protein